MLLIGGKSALTRYVRYSRKISSLLNFTARQQKYFLELPTPRYAVFSVAPAPAAFKYFTPGATDELHGPARSDFVAWEPVSRNLFSLLSKNAGVVLDVGAYSGVYALTALATNPSVQVFAFEPNLPMTKQILESSDLNEFTDRLAVYDCALADYEGFAQLQQAPSNSSAGIASIVYSHDQHPINVGNPGYHLTTNGVHSVEVRVRQLDSFDFGAKVALMKVDAEGSEVSIFRGARELLQESQPIILSEALTLKELEEQFEELKSSGYMAPIAVDEDGFHGDDCNFVWCHSDDYEAVIEAVEASRRKRCWCHAR